MRKIVILGSCPLPFERQQITQGPGHRTWQFIKPLLRQGYEVVAFCLRPAGAYDDLKQDIVETRPLDDFVYYNLSHDAFTNESKLKQLVSATQPEAILAVSSVLPVYMGARLHGLAPLWADFFGDPITEIQVKAQLYDVEESNQELFHSWKLYNFILTKADKFSCVSDPHRYAVVGHLALAGRLNKYTGGYNFVHTVPCGIDEEQFSHQEHPGPLDNEAINPEDFIIYWSGSFNTWVDIDTLMAGLEKAMANDEQLKFLATGGSMRGYDEEIYNRFLQQVNRSKFKDRFIIKGWLPNTAVAKYFLNSQVGINVDRWGYEAELGSRNRIVHFLAHGLPVISTVVCQLTQQLDQQGFIFGFPLGNSDGLAKAIMAAKEKKNQLNSIGQRASKYILEEFNFTNTLQPCLKWLQSPQHSPDNEQLIKTGKTYLNEPQRYFDFHDVYEKIKNLEQEKASLDRLRSKPFYRFYKTIQRIFRSSAM